MQCLPFLTVPYYRYLSHNTLFGCMNFVWCSYVNVVIEFKCFVFLRNYKLRVISLQSFRFIGQLLFKFQGKIVMCLNNAHTYPIIIIMVK